MKIGEKASFIVTLTSRAAKDNGYANPAEIVCELEAQESGAFAYGNQTATVLSMTDPEGTVTRKVYDTRYSKGDFESVCNDLLWDYFGENIDEIDRTDIERQFILRLYDFSGKQIKQKTFKAYGWHDAENKEMKFRKAFGLEWADSQMNILK